VLGTGVPHFYLFIYLIFKVVHSFILPLISLLAQQINSKHKERRVLVAESCGALAPFVQAVTCHLSSSALHSGQAAGWLAG